MGSISGTGLGNTFVPLIEACKKKLVTTQFVVNTPFPTLICGVIFGVVHTFTLEPFVWIQFVSELFIHSVFNFTVFTAATGKDLLFYSLGKAKGSSSDASFQTLRKKIVSHGNNQKLKIL